MNTTNFRGDYLKKSNNKIGRPTVNEVAMTGAQRVTRHRHSKKQELLQPGFQEKRNESTINTYRVSLHDSSTKISGTIFSSLYQSAGTLVEGMNLDEFIEELKRCHNNVVETKTDNNLISPSVFDLGLSETTDRGRDNVVYATGIWLDNDGGDLTPEEFRKLFPDLKILFFNTYSSSPEKQKYRVVLTTTDSMSADEYSLITHFIIQHLEDCGFYDDETAPKMEENGLTVKRHGFDMTKLTAESLFYLPCQAENPKNSFFIEYEGTILDPKKWLKSIEIQSPKTPDRKPYSVIRKGPRSKLQIDGAKDEYKTVPAGLGRRNLEFFNLGWKLKRFGLDEFERRQHLRDADWDHSRGEKAIRDIEKTLLKDSYR